jgi:predicted HAD superfamily Cof-like phosphohydrolase
MIEDDTVSSGNPYADMKRMYSKYKFDEEPLTREKLSFRMSLLNEEYHETFKAYQEKNPDEWIDGLIDLVVIAIGNLYLAGVDFDKAWQEVFRANMSKVRGVKKGRESSGGFDVIKPEGWSGPDHSTNHGVLDEVFST